MMFKRKPKTRRKWLVNYSMQGCEGRIFMTTEDGPLTEELIRKMDDWLRDNGEKVDAFITSAIPLELITPTETKP
jgi:hypothetical protein